MKKSVKNLISVSISSFLVLSGCLSVYFSYFHHYKGKEIIYNWSINDSFDINSIKVVNKDPNKDFVIMNLADLQLYDINDFHNRNVMHKQLTKLVNEIKPDLITLTGDQTFFNENLMSLRAIIRWLDDFKIPYAPVFGNHDLGNSLDEAVAGVNKSCTMYENGKYSLFSRGPSNLGSYGNYVINIKENNKIIRTLYMLDSGYTSYISDQQKAWVKYNADNIKQYANNNNQYVEGMVFFHKPIPEYIDAYRQYRVDPSTAINNVYVYSSLYGSTQNEFFALAKSINVKDIVCGHQHANNFTIKYEDVRLTFAVKTGETCFVYNGDDVNLNGATFFKISNNNTEIDNYYVGSDEFKFKYNGCENIAKYF